MTKKTQTTVFIVVGIVAVSALVYFLFFRNRSASGEIVLSGDKQIPDEVQKLARDFEDGESLNYGGSIYDMYSGTWSMRG